MLSRQPVLLTITGPFIVIHPTASLTIGDVVGMQRRIELLFDERLFHGVVLSLARAPHIGYGAFEPLKRLADFINGHSAFVVCDASPYVRQVLNFQGAYKRMSICPTLEQAVCGLQLLAD